MKSKINLQLTLSLNRRASKKEIHKLIELCASILDTRQLYDAEINPDNEKLPLKVEHHFVDRA
jgi:hypothetical protein